MDCSKRRKNGVRVKVSTNTTGVDVLNMLTVVLCNVLINVAKLNSLDITVEILAERYKDYLLDYLKKFTRQSKDGNADNTRKTAHFYKKSSDNHEMVERQQVKNENRINRR